MDLWIKNINISLNILDDYISINKIFFCEYLENGKYDIIGWHLSLIIIIGDIIYFSHIYFINY